MFQLQKLKGCDDGVERALEESHRLMKENPNDTKAKERVLRVCRVALESKLATDSVMQIALELDDLPLFRRSMGKLWTRFSIPQSSLIANIIFLHGLEAIRSA